ncbi:MAG: hypothetical protein B7Z80_15905 [Rhodospirillales bacterium 20-64-7]|nr:MAG: hypothetical protein B7Z80_15905 [Rhodospirillales bacterium 20-64-7]HQT78446.1 class I SAM-dependent methyltransferase [Rhodopila sp.]
MVFDLRKVFSRRQPELTRTECAEPEIVTPGRGGAALVNERLARYLDLLMTYDAMAAAYAGRGTVRHLDRDDKEYTASDEWAETHYFSVGEDAIRIVVQALTANLRPPPRSILDFPSGSGRVTRHLRAFFPAARIIACDLYPSHVEFCRTHLAVDGMVSKENLSELDFGATFDLIFCGSLMTHLPAPLVGAGLELIARSLSDRGVAIVTLQGRHSEHIQKHKWKYLDDALFDVALEGMQGSGFGYVDYDHDFRRTFDQQTNYGVSLIRPDWIMARLQAIPDIRILGFAERAWDDHHDVVVFGKPSVNADA